MVKNLYDKEKKEKKPLPRHLLVAYSSLKAAVMDVFLGIPPLSYAALFPKLVMVVVSGFSTPGDNFCFFTHHSSAFFFPGAELEKTAEMDLLLSHSDDILDCVRAKTAHSVGSAEVAEFQVGLK